MKFSRSSKDLYQVTNFNPPPGYYKVPTSFQLAAALEPEANSFNREKRFRRYTQKVDYPGPGQYHRTNSWIKKGTSIQPPNNRIPSPNQVVHYIPSIPSQNNPYPYQFTENGEIYLRMEPVKAVEQPVISSCSITKPRPIAYKFRPDTVIPKAVAQPKMEETQIFILDHEANFKKREIKPYRKPKPIQRNIVLMGQKNMYLELIMLRERQLRPYQPPPPGYYYQNKTAKPPSPNKVQCFNSTEKRFNFQHVNAVGPGYYCKETAGKKATGGLFSKAKKEQRVATQSLPGPGAYQLKQSKSEDSNLKKLKYPNAFMSGQRRFETASTVDSGPGPGQYESARASKRKFKRSTFSKGK